MRKGRKMLPYIAEMPKPYVFDIERINKELKENSKVIEGIKDYIANKCDTAADTEHSLSGTPTKAVQLVGELGEHPENYSSFEDGTYNWFPVSVFDKRNKTEFDTFKNLEKEPEFDERRYTRISSWAKGTYIEEVLKVFKNQVTRVHMRRMSSEGYLNYHMDYDTKYSIRFHIPLTTNPDCYFKFKRTLDGEEEKFHLPADGRCYFFNQGAYHSAFNEGNTDRDHLILAVNGQDDISFI
jgi:hypothetical protein